MSLVTSDVLFSALNHSALARHLLTTLYQFPPSQWSTGKLTLNNEQVLAAALAAYMEANCSKHIMPLDMLSLLSAMRERIGIIAGCLHISERNDAPIFVVSFADWKYAGITGRDLVWEIGTLREIEQLAEAPTVFLTLDLTAIWFEVQDRINGIYNDRQAADQATSEVAAAKANLDQPGNLCDDASDPAN